MSLGREEEMRSDHLKLKDAILGQTYMASGVQSVHEFMLKNYEKLFKRFNISLDDFMKDIGQSIIDEFFGVFIKKEFDCFDDRPPFQLDKTIVTGSLSEGICMTIDAVPPDMDFMCVLKNITFSQKDQEGGNLVLRDDTPFVYAYVTDIETQELWRDYLDEEDEEGKRRRLSSRKLKEKLAESYRKLGGLLSTVVMEEVVEVTEGAAVTVHRWLPALFLPDEISLQILKEFLGQSVEKAFNIDKLLHNKLKRVFCFKLIPSSDFVLSISCDGWPMCAKEWITRERLWPEPKLVEKIAQSGFHIVPKSSSEGDFRLSFSCVETMLIKSLTPLQYRVMGAFKYLIKHHREIWSPTFREFLSSYHVKTIAFWYFEKTSQESWSEDTIVHHLIALLEELAQALKAQTLPMYFMPKFNLLRNADDPGVMLDLMENVLTLSRDFNAMSASFQGLERQDLVILWNSFSNQLDDISKGLRVEKLKKEQEGGESSFTVFDCLELVKTLWT